MASIVVRLLGEDLTASKSLEHLAMVGETTGRRMRKQFGELPKWATEAAIGVAAGSTYLAANFETATTRLVTDAGEIPKNLGKVREGVLSLAGKVGETPVELAKGLYTVESAGYHGAAGLTVLKAAAQGAADGGADLKTVSDAVTTTLTDYHVKAGDAATVTSQLVETVSRGKTNMEDLAGSLHSVLPGAEAAHLGLGQVLGAMATMTGEGIAADQASENLNHAILSLQNPTQVQTKAMAAMGLSSVDVAKNLGKKGLTGTYETLSAAITKHMGPAGLVVQNTMNQSKLAAQSADEMYKRLPASVQSVAKSYLAGTITQKEWTNAVKAMTPEQANLAKQWAESQNRAHGFADALKSGQGPFGTYAAELSKMTGGQTGLQVALHLTGSHMTTFKDNVKAVSGTTAEAGGNVKGYAAMQKTLNQQLKDSEAGVAVVGTRLGTALIPAVVTVLKWTQQFGGALASNRPLLIGLGVVVGTITAGLVAMFVAQKLVTGVTAIAKVAEVSAALATKLYTGSLREAIAAQVASKAETAALAALYAKDFVAGLLASGAALVKQTARTVAGTAAFVVQRTIMIAGTAATWLATAATTAFGVAIDIATGPVGLIILAVGALIAIIVLLVIHWKDVCSFLKTTWGAVSKWFGDTLTSVGHWWSDTWKGIVSVFHVVLAAVVSAFTHWTLLGIIVSHWSQILAATKRTWGAVTGFIGGIPHRIIGFFAGIGSWLFNAGRNLLHGLMNGGREGLAAFGRWELSLARTVIGWLRGAGSWLYDSGQAIINGLINGVTSRVAAAGNAVSGVLSYIASFFPHSPAERGPFSGAGWTAVGSAGAAIIDQVAAGATGRAPAAGARMGAALGGLVPAGAPQQARSTVAELFGGAGPNTAGGGYGSSGGGATFRDINLYGSTITAEELLREADWRARVYGR